MKKKLLLILFLVIIFGVNFTTAQSQNHLDFEPVHKLQYWNSLLKLPSSSKTTNTVKNIKASSEYSNGNLDDSFLVLEPSDYGYSRLDPMGLYFSPNSAPRLSPLKDYGLSAYAYTDFNLAIHYFDDLTQADTMMRVYDALNFMTSSYLNHRFNPNTGFVTENYIYSYDAQGRLSSIVIDLVDTSGVTPNYQGIMTYTYSPTYDYLFSEFTGTIGGQASTTFDSAVIVGGLVTSYYAYNNGNLIGKYLYSYDANYELSKAEIYNTTGLIRLNEFWNKQGSDYPDSFLTLRFDGADSVIFRSKFDFDPLTSFPTKLTRVSYYLGTSNVNTCDITTDLDGDITKQDWKGPTGSTFRIVNIYYEDFPAGLDEAGTFDADIQAFPVPSPDNVKINSSELFDGYALYDISGKLLQSSSFSRSLESRVDLSSYSSGIYFLEVISDGKFKTLTLEKQ